MKQTLVKIAFVAVPLTLAIGIVLAIIFACNWLYNQSAKNESQNEARNVTIVLSNTNTGVQRDQILDDAVDNANLACKKEMTWVEKNAATSFSTGIDYSEDKNSATVTVYINPVIFVDGYFVNFKYEELPAIYKDGEKVTGQERALAMAKAIETVDGNYGLIATYKVTLADKEYVTNQFTCNPQ